MLMVGTWVLRYLCVLGNVTQSNRIQRWKLVYFLSINYGQNVFVVKNQRTLVKILMLNCIQFKRKVSNYWHFLPKFVKNWGIWNDKTSVIQATWTVEFEDGLREGVQLEVRNNSLYQVHKTRDQCNGYRPSVVRQEPGGSAVSSCGCWQQAKVPASSSSCQR